MKRSWIHFCLSSVLLLSGSGFSGYVQPVEKDYLFKEAPLVKGIVLVNEPESISAFDISKIEGIEVRGVSIPGGVGPLRDRLAAQYLGKPLDRDSVLAMKHEILSYYQEQHRPMVIIEIPEQDISHGVLLLVVRESKAGKVYTKGNRWFSDKQLLSRVRIHSGDVIDEEVLLNDVAWLNRNPFHYTNAVLQPGSQKGTTDIELDTKDRFPLRLFVGGDNTGNDFTGNARYYTGFNWGDAFGRGDQLSYQFTTTDSVDLFSSHYGQYIAYMPWKHFVNVYGGYARIHPRMTDFHTDGKASQASGRYTIPFKPLYTPFKHELALGFDWKNTNSILFFIGELEDVPVVTQEVNLTQFVITYSLEDTLGKHDLTFDVEAYFSPGEWLSHQSNRDYNLLRPHAKNRYFYTYASLGDTYHLPHEFAISGLLRLQAATGTLLPSEQFGLGGYDSVRGYDEREVIADNALCLNLEVRTPPLHLIRKHDELTFHAFMDYGLGYNYHPFTGQSHVENLISVGPGFRYGIKRYLSFRVDYGFQLHHTDLGENQFGKIHVGAALSF